MTTPSKNKYSVYFWLAAVLVLTVLVYLPVLKAGFTNWDDQLYVYENRFIQQLSIVNIRKFFNSYFVGNYHPFTMLSIAFDFYFAKLNPLWYHIHNLLLHLINTLLVYWFIRLLTKKQFFSVIVALLFGIHTMHVESVAWIAERKDVLYTFFFLLSAVFYVKYLTARTENRKASGFYLVSLVFFISSLFSKAQAVTLPVVLLLTDYFLGRDIKKLSAWIDKIPFFLLSLTFGIIALYAQKSAAAFPGTPNYNFIETLVLANYNITVYVVKLVMPLNLSTFYPLPGKVANHLPIVYWIFVPAVFLLSAAVVLWWKKKRALVFGLLFFLINVVLLLQVISVGGARIADRYMYIPSIGFFFIVALGFEWMKAQYQYKRKIFYQIGLALFVCWIVTLSVLTFQRSKVWNNSLVLWTDVLEKFPGTQRALINRGNALFDLGKHQEAIRDYNIVLSKNMTDVAAYINRGRAKANIGDLQGAISDFTICTRLAPGDYLPFYNLGILYALTGDKMQSYAAFSGSIRVNPQYAEAYYYRAQISIELGYKDQMCLDYRAALNLGYQPAAAAIEKYCR